MLRLRGRRSRLWRGGDSRCWPIRTSELLSDTALLWRCTTIQACKGLCLYKELHCFYITTKAVPIISNKSVQFHGSNCPASCHVVCGQNVTKTVGTMAFVALRAILMCRTFKNADLRSYGLPLTFLFGHREILDQGPFFLINMYDDVLNGSPLVTRKSGGAALFTSVTFMRI